MSDKRYVIKLTKPSKQDRPHDVLYVAKHRGGHKTFKRYRPRRGAWFITQRSYEATEFESIEAAKRVIKTAKFIVRLTAQDDWAPSIHLDIRTERLREMLRERSLFRPRKLQEVWPNPNAIDLLARLAEGA